MVKQIAELFDIEIDNIKITEIKYEVTAYITSSCHRETISNQMSAEEAHDYRDRLNCEFEESLQLRNWCDDPRVERVNP